MLINILAILLIFMIITKMKYIKKFTEAMGTLSNNDTEEIEDISEKWKLSSGRFEDNSYHIERFDKFHIHLTIKIHDLFLLFERQPIDVQKEFEEELMQLINRIRKFDYDIVIGNFGRFKNRVINSLHIPPSYLYTFNISHTSERSRKIILK